MPTGSEYSRVNLGGDNTSDYKTRSAQGETGEFGQCTPGDFGPYPPKDDMLPDPVPSKQFSSDVNGNPEVLLGKGGDGIATHAELNQAYGLTQPVATLGQHPWLRDSLFNPDTQEPGPAEPDRVRGVPMQRQAPNK